MFLIYTNALAFKTDFKGFNFYNILLVAFALVFFSAPLLYFWEKKINFLLSVRLFIQSFERDTFAAYPIWT